MASCGRASSSTVVVQWCGVAFILQVGSFTILVASSGFFGVVLLCLCGRAWVLLLQMLVSLFACRSKFFSLVCLLQFELVFLGSLLVELHNFEEKSGSFLLSFFRPPPPPHSPPLVPSFSQPITNAFETGCFRELPFRNCTKSSALGSLSRRCL